MLKLKKFVFCILNSIKENIENNKSPIYNPVLLEGLDKEKRFRYFWSTFNKDFNQVYKDTYRYGAIEELNIDSIVNKKLIIIENVQGIEEDINLEKRLIEIVNYCLKEDIQLIICSDIDINDLGVSEYIKCKLMSGLSIQL